MIISLSNWQKYIYKLSQLSKIAGDKMQEWVDAYGLNDRDALIRYANALVLKYGEGSAELACEMYDAIAELEHADVPIAEPADIASYGEVAKAINGCLKQSPTGQKVADTVANKVKMAGADTTLKNALRDGAQHAWIPSGDTCAFCITLASRGWEYASKQALRKGHAEHIHANCDCQYAIRFDNKTNVAGYDPEVYRQIYENAEGNKPKDKINSINRMRYASNKEMINTQKREAYAKRKELGQNNNQLSINDVTEKYKEDSNPGIGNITFEKNYNIENHKEEKEMAEWLLNNYGGDVVCLNEALNYEEKRADFKWNDRLWDLKTTTTNKSANSAIRSGLHQIVSNPGGIILNYNNNEIDINEIEKIIEKRMRSSSYKTDNGIDIMIISKNKTVKILKYKK